MSDVSQKPQVQKPKPKACETCGNPTREKDVDVTMWAAGGLVMIENVPARVCNYCQEQYYDEATSQKIIKLASNGFPEHHRVRQMSVSVFSLDKVGTAEPETDAKQRQGS